METTDSAVASQTTKKRYTLLVVYRFKLNRS